MSDLIMMYLYYEDLKAVTYLYEEYRMYEKLLRDLSRMIEAFVD